MTVVHQQQPEQALYGGFRRSRTFGVGNLNAAQTMVLLVCVLVPVVVVNIFGMSSLLVSIPAALVIMTLTVWQREGMPLLSLAAARVRWQLAAWRGETSWRGTYLPYPVALDLPGIAAPTKLLRVEDPASPTPVGLVWNQRTGTMSGTLLLSPGGTLLAPTRTVDRQVASWGETLGRLADEETVKGAAVTIQVKPASGAALSTHVSQRVAPAAPEMAKKTLASLVDRAPRASAQMTAWFTLTSDPGAAAERPRTPEDAAAETLRALDAVDLGGSGADVLRRATDTDIKRLVRGAYIPSEADAEVEEIEPLTWDECGPSAAEDGWTEYQHDGDALTGLPAISTTWVLREAPRRSVPYDVLLKLLSPGRFPRRVTIAYRVLPSEAAAALVDREMNAAAAREDYRHRTKRAATRREVADAHRATQASDEEAHGAGVVQWAVFVTTTVTHQNELVAARREITKAAQKCGGIRLRPAYGSQAAAFTAGLPMGLNPLAD